MEKNKIIGEPRIKLVRMASIIALIGNVILCVFKIGIGLFASNLSVIGDGLDSAGDVAIALMSIFISYIISIPSDKKFPWGRQRAETVASLILAFIIMFAGLQLFVVSIKKFFLLFNHKTEFLMPHFSVILIIILSIIVKLLLALNQYYIAKKTDSLMLKANAKNMANDVILSVSVLIGLILSYLFKSNLLDPITAILVSLWVFRSGIEIFLEVNVELMDGNTNHYLYQTLFNAVNSVTGVYNPHRARIRKMGSLFDIDLDIEVDANMSVEKAHQIAEEVTSAIKDQIENVYDIMIHIEPYGIDCIEEEGFGLREVDVK